MERKIDITCLSDTHGFLPNNLPGGDLLIICGDLTARHTIRDYEAFVQWLNNQQYSKKIVIAGNHDDLLQREGASLLKWAANCEYLCDSGTEFEGLKIWGSPWSLYFPQINPRCTAFTGSEEELAQKFAFIPDDVDILVTHSPPYRIFDINKEWKYCGSTSLRKRIEEICPLIHCFGHIHENGGQKLIFKRPGHGTENNTIMVNASYVNEDYKPVNKPVRVIL